MTRSQLVAPVLMAILLATAVPDIAIAQSLVVDYRHIDLFEEIPSEYLDPARDLGFLFSDRSVGQNIHEGLDCLTAPSWPQAPAHCRRDYYDGWLWKTYSNSDWEDGLVPYRILYEPDPDVYNRSNWTFEYRAGSWEELTCDFVNSLAPSYLPTKDVLSYQFSYLNVDASDDIADPETGFFADRPDHCDIGDLEELIEENPDKTFLFWTTSLARGIGTDVSTRFNDQVREYCSVNDHVLFDAASIWTHTDTGTPCYDNRDGIPYEAQSGGYENYPDDGVDEPAICQDYTTEVDGGHLGSVSAGKIRIAKGLWVLMAQLAGWVPDDPVSTDELDQLGDDTNGGISLDLATANPSAGDVIAWLRLDEATEVRIELFDASGRRVRELENGLHLAGRHELRFPTGNLASGAYVLRLRTRSAVAMERIVIIR